MKLKKWLLLFLCTVFVLTGFLSVSRAEAETKTLNGRFAQTEARAMLSRINDYRTGGSWYWNKDNTTKTTVPAGTLSTLSYDYGLERIAMQRAAEIVELFDHQRPNGEWCFTCTYNKEKNILETYKEGTNVGPNIVQTWGENIAAGYPSEESVFVAWREDDEDYAGQGHRRNMLEPRWNAVGIACFVYNNRKYWVQEFGEANSNTAYAAPNDSSATVEVELPGGSDSTPSKVKANFTKQPENVTAAPGQTVTFSVEASGAASYQWIYHTSDPEDQLWYGSRDIEATKATYTLTATADMDGYIFMCVVTDDEGNEAYSDEATLTVIGGSSTGTDSSWTLVHTFTSEEAEAGGLPVLITAQGYDPRGTLHTCTSGPILPLAGDW